MRYQRSYLDFFQNPAWPLTLAAGAVCQVIPLVGWTLYLGYLLEVLAGRYQQPGQPYAPFDLGRIGHYLARGLWPGLLLMVVCLPVVMLLLLALSVTLFAGQPGQPPSLTAKILATWLSLSIGAVVLVLSLLVLPVVLYLGWSPQADLTAALQFGHTFLKLVPRELLLAEIFVLATGSSLTLLGLLLCGLGMPPALALVGFAQFHLLAQLYDLYVQRGGTALTIETVSPVTVGP